MKNFSINELKALKFYCTNCKTELTITTEKLQEMNELKQKEIFQKCMVCNQLHKNVDIEKIKIQDFISTINELKKLDEMKLIFVFEKTNEDK